MSWLVTVGVGFIVVGILQLGFLRFQPAKRELLESRGLARLARLVPVSLGAFVLVRCLPLWLAGTAAIVAGLLLP